MICEYADSMEQLQEAIQDARNNGIVVITNFSDKLDQLEYPCLITYSQVSEREKVISINIMAIDKYIADNDYNTEPLQFNNDLLYQTVEVITVLEPGDGRFGHFSIDKIYVVGLEYSGDDIVGFRSSNETFMLKNIKAWKWIH